MTEILPPAEKLAQLDDRITFLENQYRALDTQIDAAEQALEAMLAAKKNKQRIKELDERLEVAIRGFHGLACLIVGAMLLWFGNGLYIDNVPANDEVAKWLVGGGGICIGLGLLVMTNNEEFAFDFFRKINPWQK